MWIIIVIVIVLAIVTVVGHGIWLFVANLCGTPEKNRSDRPLNDNDQAATRRYLKRLLYNNQIDRVTHNKIITAMMSPHMDKATPKTPQSSPPNVSQTPPTSQPLPPAPPAPPVPPAPSKFPVVPSHAISKPTLSSHFPAEPSRPQRPFADVFATFLVQKNIRWGELIGGMLIIGCSTAMVISFWSEISAIPALKFFIFTAMTATLYGAGLYTEHRWKLPTTSRGLLMIASLLVPLNFLAIAAFSQGQIANDPMVLAGELVAIVAFGLLALWAGRVLVPIWPRVFAVGLVATSAMQLLIRRFAHSDMTTATMVMLAMLPLICYAATSVILLVRARRWSRISRSRANSLLIILGITSFAALFGMGILAYLSGSATLLFHRVSPVLCLYGLPALACGMTMWRGIKASHLAALRTVGTSCVVFGTLLMLAAAAFAWPTTDLLVMVLAIGFVVLTAAAVLYHMPAIHVPAALCATAIYLMLWHVVAGRLQWHDSDTMLLLNNIFSGESGMALVPLAAIAACVAIMLHRVRRSEQAKWFGLITAGISALSLAMITLFGFGRFDDPHNAAIVYAIYAAAAMTGAYISKRSLLSSIGSALLLAALVQAVVFRFQLNLAWPTAMLAHALPVCLAGCLLQRQQWMARPLLNSAAITSAAAAVLLIIASLTDDATYPWLRMVGVAAVWFALALRCSSSSWFAAGQAALAMVVTWCVVDRLHMQPWFGETRPFVEPWVIYPVASAVIWLNLAWIGLRLWLRRGEEGSRRDSVLQLTEPAPISFDYAVNIAMTVGAVALSYFAIMPHVRHELTGKLLPLKVFQAIQDHGTGPTAWVLLASILVVSLASQWRRFNRCGIAGALLAVWTSGALTAALWIDQNAVASALRWIWLIYLTVGSAALWQRYRIVRLTTALHWPGFDPDDVHLAIPIRASIMAITLVPLLLLSSSVWLINLDYTQATPSIFSRIGPMASYVIPLAIAAMVMLGHALRDQLRRYLFFAAIVINAAATVWWTIDMRFSSDKILLDGLLINIIALGAGGLLSLLVELKLWKHRPILSSGEQTLHRLAAILCTFVTLIVAVFLVSAKLQADSAPVTMLLAWASLAVTAILIVLGRADLNSRQTAQLLYIVGLTAIGLAIQHIHAPNDTLIWAISLMLGGYIMITGLLARQLSNTSSSWLTPTNLVIACGVALYACCAKGQYDANEMTSLLMRIAAAAGVCAAATGVAATAHNEQESGGRVGALILFQAAALALGWAWLNPYGHQNIILHRMVIAMTAMAVMIGLYSYLLVKRLPAGQPWHVAVKNLLPWMIAAGIFVLLTILFAEVSEFLANDEQVDIAWWARITVMATLSGLFVFVIALAAGKAGTINLTTRQRMTLVYAAEVLLGLLFLHVRVTMPWLFHGLFQQYWPMIIMAIAFVGVGLSEWFSRREQDVFAQPLLRTGAFLPLLPVMGFWMAQSRVDYSGLLVVVGILYGTLSVMRASFGFGVFAAIAANGALLSFLYGTENFGFFDHPQLWMIPPAISGLIAVQLNRRQLGTDQVAMGRYFCLMVIYVSSTADIFINGIADSLWLPMILAGLSVAGVLLGIILKLRSFLYLGSTFLLLSLITMIRFASVNLGWTWIWYLSGFFLGIAIIVVFAVFEKKRIAIMEMMDQLKRWDS